LYGVLARLATKDTDQWSSAFGFDVYDREIVEPIGGALVNNDTLCAIDLNNVAIRCKGLACQWRRR
jgi:hypothetical protein